MSYYTYIMANKYNTTIYVGITNNLVRRVYEHKSDSNDGFTKRYRVHKLVYYEKRSDAMDAIRREKQIKSWSRKKKRELIERHNPDWEDIPMW